MAPRRLLAAKLPAGSFFFEMNADNGIERIELLGAL